MKPIVLSILIICIFGIQTVSAGNAIYNGYFDTNISGWIYEDWNGDGSYSWNSSGKLYMNSWDGSSNDYIRLKQYDINLSGSLNITANYTSGPAHVSVGVYDYTISEWIIAYETWFLSEGLNNYNLTAYAGHTVRLDITCGYTDSTPTEVLLDNIEDLDGLSGASSGISGHIYYTDIDGTIAELDSAIVSLYNDTLSYSTTSDASGYYEIEIPYAGVFYRVISKSDAFSTDSELIEITNVMFEDDINLKFSKPTIINNGIVGKFFEGNYSHNFKTMNMWENPSYVWGLYNISGMSYIKPCIYSSGTIFVCDIFDTDKYYTMRFMYSDIYNQNLTKYHPTLTGNRSFVSNSIIGSNLQTDQINTILSNRPVAERETYIKGELWDIIFLMLIIFGVILVTTFNQRRR